jgi:hypothetical protein
MQNKTNRWLDVQIVIFSLALTFSLSLWNRFAGNNQPVSNPKEAALPTPAASPSQPAAAAIIYLGGPAPQPLSFLPEPTQSLSSGNLVFDSSPSNSPAPAPAPVTSTGSSRP